MKAPGLSLTDVAEQERRLERQAQAEEDRKEKAERDRQKKKWDEIWKDFDRTFQRMDPDYKPR